MKTFKSRFLLHVLISTFMFSSIAAVPTKGIQPATQNTHIKGILEDLGGYPCFDGSAFTCVTINVPLNHFNPADSRTLDVTFAVLPASGVRKGMFVTATGGPGYSGVSAADYYITGFDPGISEAFDIVFFDQRGLLLSGDQTCPLAANIFYEQDGRGVTPAQEAALKQSASTFTSDCVSEVSNPNLLPFLGTQQAVEDLEYFRQLIGDEKIWLYGESYGTQYAQTYAASHAEHLAGLILDGTVDLTFDGMGYYSRQAQAFNDTLVASLSVCNNDPACKKDLLGHPIAAYDNLATKLKKRPISFKFPLPQGGFSESRNFTFANLELIAVSQMYNESDRMLFVRALAAYTSKMDIVPLARFLYAGVDPQTLEVIPDPTYSDAVYYAVECQDYGYPGNSPDEKAELYLDSADPFEASIPRLASLIYADMPCAYWPNATSNLTRPNYLLAGGIPTLVLGATADPATPVGNGINVYHHLADAYLIIQQGGPHVIFGRGNECPDALVTNFLVNDIVPPQRETTCNGRVMDDYVPNAPRFASTFRSPRKALSAMETEIYYLPEFYYWDTTTPTSVGCNNGGVLNFAPNSSGTKYNFTLSNCALTTNFIMTGTGSYNIYTDRFVLDVKTTGRWQCNLRYVRLGAKVNITGRCDGKSVNENYNDDDLKLHNAPEHDDIK